MSENVEAVRIQLEEKRGGKSGVWRRERTNEAGQ